MDYLRQVFHLTFAVIMMYALLDCKIKFQKHRKLVILYAAAVLIFNMYFIFHLDYDHYMNLIPLLLHLPVFIVFVFLSEFNAIKVFFIHLTLIAIIVSFTVLGSIISYFLGTGREAINIIVYCLYLPTSYVIYKYIRPNFLYMMRNFEKGWLGFCVIPLSYYVLIYSYTRYSMDKVIVHTAIVKIIIFFVMAFAAYYMIFRFFKQSREHHTLQNQQNLLQMQVAAAQAHLEAEKESQEKIILYRHDIRHHLMLINSYLFDNNREAAQKYIAEAVKTIDTATIQKYCTNYTVNLILYSHIAHAKEEEIQVETQIDLPEENHVSDMDLCIVFGNAIENAANACRAISAEKDRYIKIVCKNKNNKIFIQIKNSCTGNVEFVDDLPVSTRANHGLGTKSIAAVTQKYGGVYSFSVENEVFTTSIIL